MLIINKLIIASKINEEVEKAICNMIRNKNGEIDFSIITAIPIELKNFEYSYGSRFDKIINEISLLLLEKNMQEEIEEIIQECEEFMSLSEIDNMVKAAYLKEKYNAYNKKDYYKNNVGVSHNYLFWDENLPNNNNKQFSFYTHDNPPENWVENLSLIFEEVEFELHYKEQSMSKYRKIKYKKGIRI